MEATDKKGVWKSNLAEGYDMLIDTNKNVVVITTPNDNPITYSVPDGITIADIERIRADAIENYNLTAKIS